jgi:PAS domain S-box-containing protein
MYIEKSSARKTRGTSKGLTDGTHMVDSLGVMAQITGFSFGNGETGHLVIFGAIFTLLALFLFALQHRRKQYYQNLYEAEVAWRASEERYRKLFDTIPLIIYTVSVDGRITSLSPAFEQMTGWSVAAWVGRAFAELVAPEDRETVFANFEEILTAQQSKTTTLRIISASGELLVIQGQGAPVWKQDNLVGISGYGRDISEQTHAEEQIRYQVHLLESVSDAIISTNLDAEILTWNQAAETTYGWSREEVIGHPLADVLATHYVTDDRDSALQQLLDEGRWKGEVIQRHKNGAELSVLASVSLLRDNHGDPIGAVGINRDITEQVQSQKALTKVEHIYREAIRSAGGVPYQRDYSGDEYAFLGDGFEELTGFTAEEMNGAMYSSRVRRAESYGEFASLPFKERQQLARAGVLRTWREDSLFERKDGSLVWLADHAVPVYDDANQIIGSMGILMDITERKRAEEERQLLYKQLVQVQRMEMIGQMAGGVAHDFNNLLAIILMRTELAMLAVEETSPVHRHLTEILKTGRRSAEVTRQLLGFARRQPIAPRVLDLNDVIDGLLPMVRRLTSENIELIWRPAADLGAVKMDPAQIDQILVNLCINARDAITGSGEIIVSTENGVLDEYYVAAKPDLTPGDYVQLTVSDNGSGMEKSVIEHIFEPFFTTKEVGQGTGLGLATVYGIVQQNHGHIIVHSTRGLGTTFKIYLPRHTEAVEQQVEPAPLEITKGQGQTILLVEDEEAVLDMCAQGLHHLGYNVISTNSPTKAIQLSARRPSQIELLLTDVVMTEMSGHELSKRLMLQQPGLRVLYMSGYPIDLVAQHTVLSEDIHLLPKPFSLPEMAQRVHEVLHESRPITR